MDVDALRQQRFAAFRADHQGVEHLAAALVLVKHRAAARIDHVDVAPMHDRHDHGVEVEPLLREDVFVALGRGL